MANTVHNLRTMEQILSTDNTTKTRDISTSQDYPLLQMVLVGLMHWPYVVFVPLGVVGNMISFLITTKKSNKNLSTCVYMSALSVVDTMILISVTSHRVIFVLGQSAVIQYGINDVIFFWYWSYTAGMSSGLYLAYMSLDRAIAVTFPLKAKTFCTTSRAKKAVSMTFFIPAILNVNMFFTYQVDKDITGFDTAYLNYPEALWVEQAVSAYMLTVGTIIPFIIIMTCNIVIIASVQKAGKSRNKMAAGEEGGTSQGRHLTRMLIFVTVAYIVLSIPMRLFEIAFSIPAVIEKYDMSDPYWQLLFNVELWIVTDLWNLNYAVNFYLYFLGGGKKYRNDAKQVFFKFFSCSTKYIK
ncbi:probable G-protein coupled receptor B0563.6 [Lineus longissimus]|uniref:probable G-protein coupled receptor B0563.6 n=1 Tax=Lineus longissimus TaxID=88925 RepID=UPI002B4F384A